MEQGAGVRGLSTLIEKRTFFATNRTGSDTVKGGCYSLILGAINSEPGEMGADTLWTPGSATDDVTANVIDDLAQGTPGVHVIAMGVYEDNAQGLFLISGIVQCVTVAGVERGEAIAHAGANSLDTLGDTASTPEAIALQDRPTSGLTWCIFDGLHGLNGVT